MTSGGGAGRRLRVAIFGESYLPYLSGVTIATQALARGLRSARHEVLLVMPRPATGTGPDLDGLQAAWLPSYQAPRPAPPGYRIPWPVPSPALRAVRSFRPDVVHAQSPFVSGVMARSVARAAGAPLVFTHHTRFLDYAHYLGPVAVPGRALLRRYLRGYWGACAGIVAPSADLAAEISAQLGDAARRRPIVRAIPTGLEIAELQALEPEDPRPLAGWPADSVVAVSVGRLAREKSLDLVLAAFAHAAQADDRLRLLLVGDGPMRAELEARAGEPALAGRLQLTGGVPRLRALALAAGSDLFVFASRTETQGLVLAEALTVGVPVVALEGPGVRDSVRAGVDGEVLPREPAAGAARRLGDAVATLAGEPGRRAALADAARQGATRFALDKRIAEVVDLYSAVLA